jgi:hypothetical protein
MVATIVTPAQEVGAVYGSSIAAAIAEQQQHLQQRQPLSGAQSNAAMDAIKALRMLPSLPGNKKDCKSKHAQPHQPLQGP